MEYQIPFTIADVANLLSVRRITGVSEDSFGVECPFCGDTRGKCNFCVAKDGEVKNVYHCYHCGASGNMLSLYAELTGIYGTDRHKKAYWEIKEKLGTGDYSVIKKRVQRIETVKKKEMQTETVRNLAERDLIYREMISMLKLKETHKRALRARGLSDTDINVMIQNGYRSTDRENSQAIARRLIKRGFSLNGIPGFYMNRHGDWDTAFYFSNEGLLCPVYTAEGKVIGFQIRLDKLSKKRKYVWFTSSGLEKGTSSKSPAGIYGSMEENTVWVTEGILKSQIAFLRSHHAYIGIPGVSNYKGLYQILRDLKKQGLQKVYECYDMDKMLYLNCEKDYDHSCAGCEYAKYAFSGFECPSKRLKRDNIRNGCLKLYGICKKLDLECLRMTWDEAPDGLWNGNYKGIDDWLMREQAKIENFQNVA